MSVYSCAELNVQCLKVAGVVQRDARDAGIKLTDVKKINWSTAPAR